MPKVDEFRRIRQSSRTGTGDLVTLDQKQLSRATWVVAVVLLLVITGIFVSTLPLKWGIGVSVAMWGVFFGATALLFLPPKAMTTTFGALLGIGTGDRLSGSGLVTIAAKELAEIANTIPSGGLEDGFVVDVTWMFFLIVTVLTVPAFFLEQ